jgi:diguanylate cyclase (GGDEF)-like protein
MDIEHRLSDVLSEFARTLVTDFPIQGILDHLVVRIVGVLPVSAAGVRLVSSGAEPRYIAASDESAWRFERLQTELDDGPGIASHETGNAVAVPDLRRDDRFPKFGPLALKDGLAAVFTFPLRHGDRQLGALDLYSTTVGPLDAEAMVAAQTLADVAAAYLLNAEARADLQESSEIARQISLHDALTGLPNRTLLVQRLDHAILRCGRSGKMVAVLFADLDDFKSINDSYGHHVGDELLVVVSERLTRALRPGDTVARLAGDEFVVLCEDIDDPSQVEPLVDRLDAALAESLVLAGAEVRVSASVGIAFAGRGHDGSEQVLQDADTAMYQAKRKGGGRHGTIDLLEQSLSNDRAGLTRDIRGASARGELRIEYQPIVSTTDGRITGVEALLRWAHPTHGMVPPETAVILAEQSGAITEIGRWVLERACLDRHGWQHQGNNDRFEISVNVSPVQLMARDFASTVAAVLTDTDTDPELVTLEVTETVFFRDSRRALVVLNDLKHLGVMLALDDFGTGHSSLSRLKRFPVDIVKIDRVFIADVGRDESSRFIVSAVVALAHSLHMVVVAEGVETAKQRDEIVTLDCEAYQGFYCARPMPAHDLNTFLATSTPA